jgi:hypothetical protein
MGVDMRRGGRRRVREGREGEMRGFIGDEGVGDNVEWVSSSISSLTCKSLTVDGIGEGRDGGEEASAWEHDCGWVLGIGTGMHRVLSG